MTIADRGLTGYQGLIMSQADLADALSVTRETVNQWQSEGLPYRQRAGIGSENGYDVAVVTTWLIGYWLAKAAGGETAKDRLARVQADRVELDIAERRGQLVDVRDLQLKLAAAIVATRALLLQLPERIASALEVTHGFEARRDMLREEIEHALRNLATYDPCRPDDPMGLGAVQPAGAHDGGALGGDAALSQ